MASPRNYYGNVRAPDFPPDAQWLNTGRPLSLADLRGKLVLLDFWTYGCINCMHIIPDLKRLEAQYPDELVVIGVHSAKFANEGDLENIRQIALRYELEHPIVNDRDFRIWRAYAARAWPTTVLIDPRGRVLAAHSGERVWEAYQALIADAVRQYDAEGILDRTPLDLAPERLSTPETGLRFPGKVLVDEPGERLFIADTNHHRIVVCDLDGTVRDVIGSSASGLQDGPFDAARLNRPQGMALDGERLYIADTENHAIRVADLQARTLETVAGDGTLTYGALRSRAKDAKLNSPWDVVLVGRSLYIAMAGTHQLWRLDLDEGMIGPYAGSGREALLDGPLERAGMAQPSGLSTDGTVLFVADSEASAVRTADLSPKGYLRTIIGEGLFEFGDVDGTWPQARLQHALGITYYQGTLYVADTYNHKIKVVGPATATSTTLLGTGRPGWRDGAGDEAEFYEPGGLSEARGLLYIADTNNHAVRVADLATRRVATLSLRDPEGRLVEVAPSEALPVLRLPEQRVRRGGGASSSRCSSPRGTR
jgi:thiol-disulfide isomerase/thioredoxin